MTAKDNKFLILGPNVILTPVIEPVIIALDKYFEKANLKGTVTSGLRQPEDQLRIIRQYLKAKGLDKIYPLAMTCKVDDMTTVHDKGEFDGESVYQWQMGWSALLNSGIIINPCARAKLLMSYVGQTKKDRKGDYFDGSNHFPGNAFDIGGAGNGVQDEAAVLLKAIDDKIPGIVNIVVERSNNCVHVNCKAI